MIFQKYVIYWKSMAVQHTYCKEEKNPSAKRESLTIEPEDGS